MNIPKSSSNVVYLEPRESNSNLEAKPKQTQSGSSMANTKVTVAAQSTAASLNNQPKPLKKLKTTHQPTPATQPITSASSPPPMPRAPSGARQMCAGNHEVFAGYSALAYANRGCESKPRGKPGPKPKPKAAPQPMSLSQDKPRAKPGPKPRAKPGPKPKAKPGPKPKAKPGPKPKAKPGPKPKAKPGPKPRAKPGPKPKAKPGPKPKAKAAPQPMPLAPDKPKTTPQPISLPPAEPNAKPGPKPKTTPQPMSLPPAEPNAKPGPKPQTAPQTMPLPPAGPKAKPGPKPKATSQPISWPPAEQKLKPVPKPRPFQNVICIFCNEMVHVEWTEDQSSTHHMVGMHHCQLCFDRYIAHNACVEAMSDGVDNDKHCQTCLLYKAYLKTFDVSLPDKPEVAKVKRKSIAFFYCVEDTWYRFDKPLNAITLRIAAHSQDSSEAFKDALVKGEIIKLNNHPKRSFYEQAGTWLKAAEFLENNNEEVVALALALAEEAEDEEEEKPYQSYVHSINRAVAYSLHKTIMGVDED